jgi:ABC-type transport system involved in multi-copper enzyme maturation permease subunit
MTGTAGRMLGSEWRKVTTTKMLWVLAVVGIGYSVVNAGTLVLLGAELFPGLPTTGEQSMLLDPDYITTLIAQVSSAATFVLILGIIAVTGEYRHMTITSTFLAAPHRGRVLVAKMGLYGILGALIALVATAIVTIVVLAALLPFDHAPLTASSVLTVLVGAVFGFALYAIVGVSLGALIKSQIAAIIIALVWVLLVEALVGLAFPAVSRWLPGGALQSVMDVSVTTDMSGQLVDADRLPAWGGTLVLLAYAAVFGVIAMRTTLRRDIT